MEDNGWIKLHRKFLQWEWYDDPITKAVFLDLLLKANHKDSRYRGTLIRRGQAIFGYHKTAKNLKISAQACRTAIKHLKSTSEITTKLTSRGQLITLLNYEKYQARENKSTSEITTKLTSDQQAANNSKEYKEEKETTTRDVENETFKKLVKWLQGFDSVTDVKAYAKNILEKYPARFIERSMNHAACTSPSQLFALLRHYKNS